MKTVIAAASVLALLLMSNASAYAEANSNPVDISRNSYSVIEPKEGEIFKPGDTLTIKVSLDASLQGKHVYYEADGAAPPNGGSPQFCKGEAEKDDSPPNDGQTLYKTTCTIPPDHRSVPATIFVFVADGPPPWPAGGSHLYSIDDKEINTLHCDKGCTRCKETEKTDFPVRIQIRKNSMDASVDNSTSPSELDKLLNSGAIIDVTDLDPARLPAHVDTPLYSRAEIFRAPQLQTSQDIIAPRAANFDVPELKVAGNISAAAAKDFKAAKLHSVSGNIDARNALNFYVPQLETAAGFIDARNAKSIDISELKFIAQRLNVASATNFNAPRLYSAPERIDARNAKEFNVPQLHEAGTIFASSAGIFSAPLLWNAGDIEAESAATFDTPELENVSLNLSANGALSFNAPKLRNVSGSLEAACATNFKVKKLENAGWIWVKATHSFNAPQLQSAGNIFVYALKNLNVPELRTAGYIRVGGSTDASKASGQRIDATNQPTLNIVGRSRTPEDTGFNVPLLKTVKDDIHAESATTFNVPELQMTWEIYGGAVTILDAPKLESTANVRH